MKPRAFLILLLIACAAPLSAEDSEEPYDCRSSFELGRLHGRDESVGKWFLGHWAIVSVAGTLFFWNVSLGPENASCTT